MDLFYPRLPPNENTVNFITHEILEFSVIKDFCKSPFSFSPLRTYDGPSSSTRTISYNMSSANLTEKKQ